MGEQAFSRRQFVVRAAGGAGAAMIAPRALAGPAAAAEAATAVAAFAAIAEVVASDPVRPLGAGEVAGAVAAFDADYGTAGDLDRAAYDFVLSHAEAVAGGKLAKLAAGRRRDALRAGLGRTRKLDSMSEGLHVANAIDLVTAYLRPEYRPGRDPLPMIFSEAVHA